jgi:dipeptidyl-peptidase-4
VPRLRFATTLALAGVACHSPMTKTPTPPASEWPAVDESFIAQSAATFGFRLGNPGEIQLAADGDVLFTRTGARSFVADLYRRDATSGEITKILDAETLLGGDDEHLSAEEKARRERMRHATRGITGQRLSDDGRLLLVPLSNRLFVVDRASGAPRELDTGDGYPIDPQLSPGGDQVAYVIDGDLHVADTAGKRHPMRLTTRASDAEENGVAEFVAQEEMDRSSGFWWSPDGASIAYQHSDLSPVDTVWVGDPAHPDVEPTPFRYPRAGTANAVVTLGVMPAAGGATTWVDWDRATYPYLCRVTWDPNAPLTLVVMNRAQTELAVLAADARGKTTVLLTEHDDAWLDLESPAVPAWLADGSGFLWSTERRGAWQLELRKRDGSLDRELTPTSLGMQDVAGFDAAGGVAWILASADPTETQVYAVPVAGGEPRAITTEPGVHGVVVARRGGRVAIVSSLKTGGPVRVEIRERDGTVVGALPSVAEQPPWMPSVEWTTATVDGRDFHAALVRPRAFDPKRRYPVLDHVYAGPTARMVAATPRAYLVDQWYADAGFVVVAIDGRGTPNRGRDWERAVHKDLITVALADQASVLQALGARYPELDLDRVGIYGWSFGGYASALAVERRPDVVRAGVAGAPVTDWALYDTFYTERYMQTPAENPDGYARSSAIVHAPELTRPLLVIHGTTDDNVHFANSLGLVEALFRAGKPFELVPVAASHMTPDPVIALALARRQLAFFRENL